MIAFLIANMAPIMFGDPTYPPSCPGARASAAAEARRRRSHQGHGRHGAATALGRLCAVA